MTSKEFYFIILNMENTIANEYNFSFPAIRGIQAGREYYVAMCPLKLVPRLFQFCDEDLPPELKAQRKLNKSRIPSITRYIIDNPDNYIFSSLTVSVDGDVTFTPFGNDVIGKKIGTLLVPIESRFLINDGQHRRAAIEEALREKPELETETISIVIFVDSGLERAQQMFADLNR
ncbi:DNA sulfur modification protein DndB [Desulfovulcanus sp.]